MNKSISIALVAVGISLAIYGADSSSASDAPFSHFFTGAPANMTLLLVFGGTLATAIGLTGLFRRSNAL